MRPLRGLRQKHFLTDHKLQSLQCLTHLSIRRQRGNRIFSHDKQRFDAAGFRPAHHVHQGSRSSRWHTVSPDLRKGLTRPFVVQVGRTGKIFGHGSHFHGALLIIFFRQTAKPRALTPEVTGQHLKIQEIGHHPFPPKRTQNVLTNQQHGTLRPRIRPHRRFTIRLRQTGLFLNHMPGHTGHFGPYRVHKLRCLSGNLLMDQVALTDGLQESQNGRVKVAPLHGQVMTGQRGDITHRGTGRQQRFQRDKAGPAPFHSLFHLDGCHGIGCMELGANQHDAIGLHNILIAHRPAMGALHTPERPHAIDIAIPRTAINLIRPDHETHEFLEQIQVFIRASGRDEPADRIRAIRVPQRHELPGHVFQGIFPGDIGQGTIGLTHERLPYTTGMRTGMIAKIPPDAEIAVVTTGPKCRIHLDQLIVFLLDRDLTSVPAIGTNGVRSFQHPWTKIIHGQPTGDGPDRTNLNTAATHVTFEFMAGPVRDLGQCPPSDGRQGLSIDDLVAIAHTAHARHAPVHLCFDDRAKVLFGKHPFQFIEPAGRGGVLVRKILQIAATTLVTHRAIQRMIAQDQLQHGLTRRLDLRTGTSHDHPVGHARTARGLQFGKLFNFHQTHPAIRVGLQFRVIAEMRHHHAQLARRLNHQRPCRHLRADAVNRHRDQLL